MYSKNNRVQLNTTASGGSWYSEEGECLKLWTWDKFPLKEPIVLHINDCLTLTVEDRAKVRLDFRCQEQKMTFQVGKVMRRSDTYLHKVIGVGRGEERGKLFLDIDKCRDALAKTQTLRDSFAAAKVDPMMPKEGFVDAKVVELANNPSKVRTVAIRDTIRVIDTIQKENAVPPPPPRTKWTRRVLHPVLIGHVASLSQGSLHALPYIEHEIGDNGRRRPVAGPGVDRNSQSYRLQQQIAKGWKCVQPRDDPDSRPRRAPVLMGGRFETCTRFAPYFTKKIRLETLRSSAYEETIRNAPKHQPVMVVCVSAASPLASTKALSLIEDVNGAMWERDGNMDLSTRICSRKPAEMPYRMYQFDITESRLLAERLNLKSVPMFLIYYAGQLVYASNCFTTQYNAKLSDHHPSVDRMYEPIHKKAFGTTIADVFRTLEQAKSDGSKGKVLPHDLRFGISASALASAPLLAKIKPYPSATIANAKKKPLLQSVACEPTGVDGIDKRLGYIFGRSGVVKAGA
jgi:hypothetical protein